MAANTAPIFSSVGRIDGGMLTAANTAKDGTGTVVTIFTADVTNGGRVERVRAKALGTNVATVLRIFVNNGGDPADPASNVLYTEAALPATTLTEAAALTQVEIPTSVDPTGFPMVLPPGHRLTAALGTAVAAGYYVSAVGGTY